MVHIDRLLFQFLELFVAEIFLACCRVFVAVHLTEHHVAATESVVGMKHRTIACGSLEKAHKHSSLVDIKLRRSLVEKSMRGCLDAIGIAAEIDSIQIHRQDFLFRVVMLKFDSDDPLLELGINKAQLRLAFTREEVLGQLLGDGAAAAAAAMSTNQRLEENAHQAAGIDTGMLVETHILCGDQRMDEVHVASIVGYLTIGKAGTVLDADVTNYLPIFRPYLGGEIGAGIL